MNVLFSGATSPLATEVLAHVLRSPNVDQVSCVVHRRRVALESPKLRLIALDLESRFSLDPALRNVDLLIHFASLTHARNAEAYQVVNVNGSLALVEQTRDRGCRQMLYLSTRCVGPQHPTVTCGPYGESKRQLENALQQWQWESLVILRPAEIYGAGGSEGVDQFIGLARRFHLVPMLLGDRRIRFAPLYYKDFVQVTASLLESMPAGVHTYELCGPEILSGAGLARTLSKKFVALPIPLWYPLLAKLLLALNAIGASPIVPDQMDRLVGDKSAEATSAHMPLRSTLTRLSDSP